MQRREITLTNWVGRCHKFGYRIGGNQSDWLVTKAQVHQCRVEHKHNMEPWIVIENPIGIPFNKITKQYSKSRLVGGHKTCQLTHLPVQILYQGVVCVTI